MGRRGWQAIYVEVGAVHRAGHRAENGDTDRAAELAQRHDERRAGAAAQTHLGRGLRAILTHVLIFHWNRLGLSATSQAVLAHAAAAALLPRD
ncbi:hypothetical protein Franean1_5369 [Parafrankia sp. EAN1pec]|nr:hypothetical protein Franean1_5369 [Frankia sp. EAN1pec]